MESQEIEEGITKGCEEAFGGDGYVHYIDVVILSHVYTGVEMYPTVDFKYVQLIACHLYINKAVYFCDLIESSSLETVQ